MEQEGQTPTTGEVFGHEFAASDAGPPDDDFSDEALIRDSAPEPGPEQQPPPQEQQPQQPQGQPQPQGQEPGEQTAAPPAESQQQPPPQQPQQQVTEPQEQPPAEGEQQQPPEAPTPHRWAGKYESPEDLEAGYKSIRRLQGRQEAQLERAQQDNARLLAALERVRPYLEAAQRQQTQQPSSEEFDLSALDASQIQALIDQRVEQGLAQAIPEVQARTQQEQANRGIAQTVDSFMVTHPDIAPGSELDDAIGELLEEFQTDRQGVRRLEVFPITHQNLEVVYKLAKEPRLKEMVLDLDLIPSDETIAIANEALENPALAEVLQAQPHLVDTDHGMAYARKTAGLPGMYQQAAQQAQAQQPTPEQARRAAHVETGGTGAPVTQAPGATPADEMDEAVASFTRGKGNVFGLSVAD